VKDRDQPWCHCGIPISSDTAPDTSPRRDPAAPHLAEAALRVAATSESGTSNTSSSWTCKSMFAESWTLLKTWPSLSISDSLLEDGSEVIRWVGSRVFLMSMIG
jgi:hypothetical protein